MNVVYTCDNNYVWIMGVSIISLFENNRSADEINVFLLGDNISPENKGLLQTTAKKYNRQVDVIDVPELHIPDALCNQRWPRSAYTRLFSGELLPNNIEQVLYLDCDTIVTSDIRDLFLTNNFNYTVSGVKDCISSSYKINIGLNKNSVYINAGVLLLNLKKLREIDIRSVMNEFLNLHSKTFYYADQDVLNGIFKGNVGVLDPKYDVMTILFDYSYENIISIRQPSNYYTENEIETAMANPAIVHFTTCMLSVRPWFIGSMHPLASDFDKYLDLSVWRGYPKKQAKFKKSEYFVFGVFLKLPFRIGFSIIGFLHCTIRPFLIRLKSKLK